MADVPLEKSPYSRHFITLKYLGAWMTDSKSPVIVNAYSAYKTIMLLMAFSGSFSLCLDLYLTFSDFKKLTWNLCISTLFVGALIKNLYSVYRSNVINKMRKSLHLSATSRQTPQDEEVNKMAARELRIVRLIFYGAACTFLPLWLVIWYLSYQWGQRSIPIPLRLPFEFDLDNDYQYNVMFFSVATGGCLGAIFVIEGELCMFTILIQISREYERFLKDLMKINEIYEQSLDDLGERKSQTSQEVNPCLKKAETKKLMKEYCAHQQELIEYTEDFELSYSFTMLLQVFVLSVLVVVSAVQCILEYGTITMNVSYQMGYISIILMDMFLVCWFATRIRSQCLEVGEKAYAILWYRMDADVQKDISMIIMRSQRPPKITSGKMMEMNLHAFMLMTRNIYSWLALFQQLTAKAT